jgi:hypothetical protein
MNVFEIIGTLRQKDIAVACSGDDLVVRAPRGSLDEATRILLKTHKAALLAHLRLKHCPFPNSVKKKLTMSSPA